jgi:hypothetical protein
MRWFFRIHLRVTWKVLRQKCRAFHWYILSQKLQQIYQISRFSDLPQKNPINLKDSFPKQILITPQQTFKSNLTLNKFLEIPTFLLLNFNFKIKHFNLENVEPENILNTYWIYFLFKKKLEFISCRNCF